MEVYRSGSVRPGKDRRKNMEKVERTSKGEQAKRTVRERTGKESREKRMQPYHFSLARNAFDWRRVSLWSVYQSGKGQTVSELLFRSSFEFRKGKQSIALGVQVGRNNSIGNSNLATDRVSMRTFGTFSIRNLAFGSGDLLEVLT